MIKTYEVNIDWELNGVSGTRWLVVKSPREVEDHVLKVQSDPDSGYVGHTVIEIIRRTVAKAGRHVYTELAKEEHESASSERSETVDQEGPRPTVPEGP